ncbi:MAG: flavin reductase family protein, partial [Candidatus Aminicenantia bacterium]
KLSEIRTYGDHDLFVGEVIAVHEQKNAFNSNGVLNTGKFKPILYLGSDMYITVDSATLKHVLPD